MFYTLEEIREQLQAGEDSFAEFKEIRFGARNIVSPNTEDLAGEIVAFTNAEGGALFFGISDQGLVRGIPKDRMGDLEEWVINIASNNCEPPIRPIIRKLVLPDFVGNEVHISVRHRSGIQACEGIVEAFKRRAIEIPHNGIIGLRKRKLFSGPGQGIASCWHTYKNRSTLSLRLQKVC